MKKCFENVIVFLMFLFWAAAPSVQNVSKHLIVVFFIGAIFFWREMKNNALRHWALLLTLPFLFALFQKLFIFNAIDSGELKTPLRFLYAGATIFMFYKINAEKLAQSLLGVVFGAVGLAVWAYLSTHFEAFFAFGLKGERASNGFVGIVHFGLLAIIFAMMSVNLPHALFFKIPKKLFLLIKTIAFAAGLYAAYASLSRTALFVLPFLMLIVLTTQKTNKKIIAVLLAVLLLGGGVLFFDNPYQKRVESSFKEIKTLYQNPTSSQWQRFLIWQHATDIIQKHPVFGTGKSSYLEIMRQRRKEGRGIASIEPVHPHNEYLNFAVDFGVPGLALSLVFFLAPLVFFIKRLKSKNITVQFAASNGAMIVAAFALGGIWDCYFWMRFLTIFYGLSVAFFVAIILQIENKKTLCVEKTQNGVPSAKRLK